MKKEMSIPVILIPVILACFTRAGICSDEIKFVPWDYNNQKTEEKIDRQQEEISSLSYLSLKGIKIFRNYISPVDGDRCPMIPTCSEYAVQAVMKHGFFIGAMMTVDRLMHEGDEARYAPAVRIGDRVGFHDPVSDNDFWFDKDKNL